MSAPVIARAAARTAAALFILALAGCGEEEDAPRLTTQDRLAMAPDIANGRRLFRACAVCHEKTEGTGHRVGPNLYGVVGAEAARHEDFAYSRALERADIVWTEEALGAYLEAPQAVIPGGRMNYPGEPDPANRRDVIAYLQTLADGTAE